MKSLNLTGGLRSLLERRTTCDDRHGFSVGLASVLSCVLSRVLSSVVKSKLSVSLWYVSCGSECVAFNRLKCEMFRVIVYIPLLAVTRVPFRRTTSSGRGSNGVVNLFLRGCRTRTISPTCS